MNTEENMINQNNNRDVSDSRLSSLSILANTNQRQYKDYVQVVQNFVENVIKYEVPPAAIVKKVSDMHPALFFYILKFESFKTTSKQQQRYIDQLKEIIRIATDIQDDQGSKTLLVVPILQSLESDGRGNFNPKYDYPFLFTYDLLNKYKFDFAEGSNYAITLREDNSSTRVIRLLESMLTLDQNVDIKLWDNIQQLTNNNGATDETEIASITLLSSTFYKLFARLRTVYEETFEANGFNAAQELVSSRFDATIMSEFERLGIEPGNEPENELIRRQKRRFLNLLNRFPTIWTKFQAGELDADEDSICEELGIDEDDSAIQRTIKKNKIRKTDAPNNKGLMDILTSIYGKRNVLISNQFTGASKPIPLTKANEDYLKNTFKDKNDFIIPNPTDGTKSLSADYRTEMAKTKNDPVQIEVNKIKQAIYPDKIGDIREGVRNSETIVEQGARINAIRAARKQMKAGDSLVFEIGMINYDSLATNPLPKDYRPLASYSIAPSASPDIGSAIVVDYSILLQANLTEVMKYFCGLLNATEIPKEAFPYAPDQEAVIEAVFGPIRLLHAWIHTKDTDSQIKTISSIGIQVNVNEPACKIRVKTERYIAGFGPGMTVYDTQLIKENASLDHTKRFLKSDKKVATPNTYYTNKKLDKVGKNGAIISKLTMREVNRFKLLMFPTVTIEFPKWLKDEELCRTMFSIKTTFICDSYNTNGVIKCDNLEFFKSFNEEQTAQFVKNKVYGVKMDAARRSIATSANDEYANSLVQSKRSSSQISRGDSVGPRKQFKYTY